MKKSKLSLPLCVNCIHFIWNSPKEKPWCFREVTYKKSLVTGKKEPFGQRTCEWERSYSGNCGIKGKYFERADDSEEGVV